MNLHYVDKVSSANTSSLLYFQVVFSSGYSPVCFNAAFIQLLMFYIKVLQNSSGSWACHLSFCFAQLPVTQRGELLSEGILFVAGFEYLVN